MKYVLLGSLNAETMTRQEKRTTTARTKMKELGIRLESVYYTQGPYDFVDVVDAPGSEAMLAFSVWYAQQGFGKIQSLPAFDERAMVKSLALSGVRGKKKR
jgi:uncharacterized protein with GYD domain